MFLSSLTLSLLSMCYLSSNNQLLDTGNMTSSYNANYGVYELEVAQEENLSYYLRYDDKTLLSITATYSSQDNEIFFNIYHYEPINFSVYIRLYDENNPSVDVTSSFSTLSMVGSQYGEATCFSYNEIYSSPYYAEDFAPLYYLSIRLLERDVYDMYMDNSSVGYQQGYDDGYSTGYSTGKIEGNNNGYNDGYNTGYDDGNASGYTTGYQSGYDAALTTHSFSFTNLFGSIADTPILMIRRLFGFELFGVSLIAVFMSLFTALLIIKIIKKVF